MTHFEMTLFETEQDFLNCALQNAQLYQSYTKDDIINIFLNDRHRSINANLIIQLKDSIDLSYLWECEQAGLIGNNAIISIPTHKSMFNIYPTSILYILDANHAEPILRLLQQDILNYKSNIKMDNIEAIYYYYPSQNAIYNKVLTLNEIFSKPATQYDIQQLINNK